ncbi:MAG: hypothetical protein Q8K22_05660, partial [Rhodoferax sp.]|nr:hypothetical protein [Rhodoferax sp.]
CAPRPRSNKPAGYPEKAALELLFFARIVVYTARARATKMHKPCGAHLQTATTSEIGRRLREVI